MSSNFDLFVIGGGSGGVRAARMAASHGARVGLAEASELGGTCVNLGCVPKKMLMYASQFQKDFEIARQYGFDLPQEPIFDFSHFIAAKNKEISRLNQVYGNLLENAGVQVFRGRAEIVSGQKVRVAGEEIACTNILIATGSYPYVPPVEGKEHAITSNQMFHLDTLPGSIVISGGGYIALEFASFMQGLGVDTTLLYRRDLFLRGFDIEIREKLRDAMVARGVNIKFSTEITSIKKQGDKLSANLNTGGSLTCDQVLFATGRRPASDQFDLDSLGIDHDNGFIKVNDSYQTSNKNIYALGDVIGSGGLTPIALAEAMVFYGNLFKGEKSKLDYQNIPTAVFCLPNMATVGMGEEEAREKLGDVQIFKSSYRELKKTLTDIPEKTFLKLVVDASTDRVVGAHMIGSEAAEVIQGVAIGVRNGLTKAQFDLTVGIHPSNAEEFVTMRTPV